jgi:DEAD/DEAH box helicase domain-containing protein
LRAAFYQDQVAATIVEEPRDAEFMDIERSMHPSLKAKLAESGVERLYSHQAIAYDLASSGLDVVVTTSTGSGKTLCYHLPALDRMLQEPSARALFIYPTKALAQDQLGKLQAIVPEGLKVSTYDGDTPKGRRAAIRKEAHLVLTNPDMLHIGILPNHGSWTKLLRSLRFIVLDEMHSYSGVFGSHVALVVRRLLRLCESHGARPQIIATSATIRNPLELFEQLTGRKAELVDRDGSVQGFRRFVMWNPPVVDDDSRRSGLYETSRIFESLVLNGYRVIAFSGSRIAAELVLSYARDAIRAESAEHASKVEAYRAGYTVADRREIERALFSGELLGLSTTNAMELGVDVGALDVAVVNGYPGSISSLRQQMGRAGRGSKDSLGILVARDDPLEQYLVEHPATLLFGKAEQVRIRTENLHVLQPQIKCAAFERPLSPSELELFPGNTLEAVEALEEAGELVWRAGMWFYPSHDGPASEIDIRGSDRTFSVELLGERLGTMEEWRAFQNAHPGAIYLHRGDQYLVRELDPLALRIEVEPTKADYYTQSLVETSVWPTVTIAKQEVGNGEALEQGLTVTNVVVGFRRRSILTNEVFMEEPLELPPHTISTIGVRIDVPASPVDREEDWSAGVHAAEHLLLALAPIIASCGPHDLGSAYYPFWPDTGRPAIFVYDSAPGGSGICEALYESMSQWISIAVDRVGSCRCDSGCPACIYSPRCPYSNENLDKRVATEVLRSLSD